MKKSILAWLLCLSGWNMSVFAQETLAVSSIPDSLKTGAYSVVRRDELSFTMKSPKEGVLKGVQVITVLTGKGDGAAYFGYYGDTFRELKGFAGELYDGNGKLLRKLKRSELKFTELSDGLASDDRLYYYEPASPVYPYTVKYEYEVSYKSGILSYPVFRPQSVYNMSVEKATYRLLLPDESFLKYKEINLQQQPLKEKVKEGILWTWQVSGLTALEKEPYAPPLPSLTPRLLASPVNFVFAGYPGDMTDWKSFGLWQAGLLQSRDNLPDELKREVVEMTKSAVDTSEKVRILYDYLARTTRYVSIQLGIGGLQPIPASEVARNHFGDCKGLTNYMKAMLQAVGIPSVYTVISTENARVYPDFPNAQQMNHVILQVPLQADTLWLECTNPQLPFGYVHHLIAGHDALLIKEEGGELCRLPTYPDSLNTEVNVAEVKLDEAGHASVQVRRTACLSQFERLFGYLRESTNSQNDFLRGELSLAQATLRSSRWKENKGRVPSVEVSYDFTSEQYGLRTGNRLFIPVNTFRNGFKSLPPTVRTQDICVDYGYCDEDSIVVHIPDNYEIEAKPSEVMLRSAFGSFLSEVQLVENTIIVRHRLYFPAGRYAPARYDEFSAFIEAVTVAYKDKIVLRKKQ